MRPALLALALAFAFALAGCKSPPPAPPAAPDAGAAPKPKPGPDAGHKPLAAALAWPRMRADRFGCFMERELGVVDKRFNCATKGYVNKGDPCKETEAYSEGPAMPDSVLEKLDPGLTTVELAWEHGELQAATLTFDGVLTQAEAFERVGLPPTGKPLPENIQSANVQACSKATTCLTLTGFDHMGAGDVDCPE
ncbi:MAG TPA: hypothetical protein VFA20_21810 [Myxococcaceae bacterium]|nr:hypothetical protein [Myxococcaceae bacterium]